MTSPSTVAFPLPDADAPVVVPGALKANVRLKIEGDSGNNLLEGTRHDDKIIGRAGDDELFGRKGGDILKGGPGFDVLDGGKGADVMDGGTGGDVYYVDNKGDVVSEKHQGPAGGLDAVYSTISYSLAKARGIEALVLEGTDNLKATGNALDNWLLGNDGNNVLRGLAGNDVLYGFDGDDKLLGGSGDDEMWGDEGDDTLKGGKGDDELHGGIGDDVLKGGKGDDELHGGIGSDILIGGPGSDHFVYSRAEDSDGVTSMDVIQGFDFGDETTGDKIDLSFLAPGLEFGPDVWTEDDPNSDLTFIFVDLGGSLAADFQIAVDDGAQTADFWVDYDFIL